MAPQLNRREQGAGPPVLLMHGFTGNLRTWGPVARILADAGFRAITYDHRGHGGSPAPDGGGPYQLEELAADCLALCDLLELEKPVVVGHSMGGMVAQMAALEAPGRFGALALVDTSARSIQEPDASRLRKAVEIARVRGLEFLFEVQMRPENLDPFQARRIAESPGLVDQMRRDFLGTSAAGYTGCGLALLDAADRTEELGSLGIPALVVVGEFDLAFRKEAELLAAAIPGARLEVISGAAHSPNLEAPRALGQILSEFASEVSAVA